MKKVILFVKIVNQYFERKNAFWRRQFRSFDGGFVRIKGAKTLYLSFKAYCELRRLAFI